MDNASIPVFPQFRKIELSDKDWWDEFTKKLNYHHCDFQFFGRWIWSGDQTSISSLNNNIVIKLPDEETDNVSDIHSFLGNENIVQTTETILNYLKENGKQPILKLVPIDLINNDLDQLKNLYKVVEQRDFFDYVYSSAEISTLENNEYKKKRNMVTHFKKEHPLIKSQIIDLQSINTQKEIFTLFENWRLTKHQTDTESNSELTAIKKHIGFNNIQKLLCIGLYDSNKLIAFSSNGLYSNEWVMVYFRKADISYKGVYEYLEQQTASALLERGYKYMNYEYDLGIEGLRKAKELWKPISYLKKVSIESIN